MTETSRTQRLVLGVESSCDETGVALFDVNGGFVAAEALHSQIALHAPYGGVVPELASRDHIKYGLWLIDQVLREAECTDDVVEAIAYTQGPGLAGALLVGAQLAASLAFAWDKPLIPVHHMEAHLLSPLLAELVRCGCAAAFRRSTRCAPARRLFLQACARYRPQSACARDCLAAQN
mgnify:CR=1 FL=1